MDYPKFRQLVGALRFGKQLPDAVYLHKSLISEASPELAIFTKNIAETMEVSDGSWNIVKYFRRCFKMTLLNYPDFDHYAYPGLHQSFTLNLSKLSLRKADYSSSENPPILHRKETFVSKTHPLYALFESITQEGEATGLYDKPRSIGFKKPWERLINSKGCFLDKEGRLHKKEDKTRNADIDLPDSGIDRHKTAIDRNKLSSPMQVLARHGYLEGEHSILDYGCGKGDDIRELEAHGVDVSGWDPVHHSDGKLLKSDIVNLGYVVNVIEAIDERTETLRRAYTYSNKLLIVSVMIAGESVIRQFTPYKDGVITSRNTFQRYYTQGEIKAYIEASLAENAVAVGQGTFIVFKDKLEEQHFLLERQHIRRNWAQLTEREARTQTQQITKGLIDQHKELFTHFWETALDLGRIPANSEFEFSDQMRRIAGSHKKAFDALEDYFGHDVFDQAGQARRDDLLVYFALGQFGRRKPYRQMPETLKRDVKFFFNNYNDATKEAMQVLFSVGRPKVIETQAIQVYEKDPIGEFKPGHSWVIPKKHLQNLDPVLRVYVGCAYQLYGDLDGIDLIKIHFTSGKVSLMRYDDFSKDVPLLMQRIKIKLRTLEVDFFDYGGEFEPPPLGNKTSF